VRFEDRYCRIDLYYRSQLTSAQSTQSSVLSPQSSLVVLPHV